MLLVVDVGNSNIVLGVFDGDKLVNHWRVVTRRDRTADEYFLQFKSLLEVAGLTCDKITGWSVSCVVPPLLPTMVELSRKFFSVEPLAIGPGIKTGMPIHVDNPREVGADRIVNAVAAYHALKSAAIVIDFGTATTFDYITGKGSFEGGVIAPGLVISMEALFKGASKLPRVELVAPPKVIGKNTVAAMQSGIIYAYAGTVDSMIDRIQEEVARDYPREPKPESIATGGLAKLLAPETRHIRNIDEDLTLKGLQIIYELNREQ